MLPVSPMEPVMILTVNAEVVYVYVACVSTSEMECAVSIQQIKLHFHFIFCIFKMSFINKMIGTGFLTVLFLFFYTQMYIVLIVSVSFIVLRSS